MSHTLCLPALRGVHKPRPLLRVETDDVPDTERVIHDVGLSTPLYRRSPRLSLVSLGNRKHRELVNSAWLLPPLPPHRRSSPSLYSSSATFCILSSLFRYKFTWCLHIDFHTFSQIHKVNSNTGLLFWSQSTVKSKLWLFLVLAGSPCPRCVYPVPTRSQAVRQRQRVGSHTVQAIAYPQTSRS